MSALGQKQTFRSAQSMSAIPPKADMRVFLPLAPTNAPAAISESARGHSRSGWAYWGKAQDKHRKACRSGDLLGRCDILEAEIRDAPDDKPAHFDSDFSAGRQA
jgi:hypothetical protein